MAEKPSLFMSKALLLAALMPDALISAGSTSFVESSDDGRESRKEALSETSEVKGRGEGGTLPSILMVELRKSIGSSISTGQFSAPFPCGFLVSQEALFMVGEGVVNWLF
jgi:hypothetical protein